MRPRPKPLLGLLLGLLLGVVIVALLWQLGVAPPDRFIVFGVLAVTISVTTLLVSQTLRRGKRRFVTSMIIAGVAAGVALTGIPETFSGSGSLSDGCHLEISSATETVTPEDTSPFDPLDTTPTDTLNWTSSTDEVLTNWDSSIGLLIAGIPITLWTADRPNAEQATEWTGSESVADYLAKIEDQTGLQVRGTFHIAAAIDADGGDCDMAGYIRVNAESAFATPLIIGLWVAGGLLVVIIVSLAVAVRRSIKEAGLYGSAVAGEAEAEAAAAASAEPIGAFVPATPAPEPTPESSPAEPVAETRVMPAAGAGAAAGAAATAAAEKEATAKESADKSGSSAPKSVSREHTVYAERPADSEIPMLEPDEPLEPPVEPTPVDEPAAQVMDDAEPTPDEEPTEPSGSEAEKTP